MGKAARERRRRRQAEAMQDDLALAELAAEPDEAEAEPDPDPKPEVVKPFRPAFNPPTDMQLLALRHLEEGDISDFPSLVRTKELNDRANKMRAEGRMGRELFPVGGRVR